MKKRILACAICLSAAIALAGCNTSADTTTPSSSEEVPSETTASEEPETTEDESGTTASANPEENCSFGHSDEIVGYGRVSDLLAGTYQLGLKGINTCSTETSFDESTYFMGPNDNIITYSLTDTPLHTRDGKAEDDVIPVGGSAYDFPLYYVTSESGTVTNDNGSECTYQYVDVVDDNGTSYASSSSFHSAYLEICRPLGNDLYLFVSISSPDPTSYDYNEYVDLTEDCYFELIKQ